jgi:hypothetical protein
MPKMTPQKRALRVTPSADSRSDFFYTFVCRLQQMHRALHTQQKNKEEHS